MLTIRAALVPVIVATLAAAPAAWAKEVQAVQVCGASDCYTFDRANSGRKLELLAEVGAPARAPSRAAPWYQLRTRIGGEGMKPVVVTNAYVPSVGLIRVDDQGGGGYAWHEVDADVRPVLRNEAARLKPRPAASLHVSDIAPGVPAPARNAVSRPSESGAGSAWLIVLAVAVAGTAAVLVVRARRGGDPG